MNRHANDWRRALFANAVSGEDRHINLALAALLLASDRYPGLDLRSQLRALDALAEGARGRIAPGADARTALEQLGAHLRGERGFNGSDAAYSSPAGCFLNEALQRRTGLPITLSAIYLEVGWRLGLPLAGVGLPGHFIIKYESPAEELFCDPFHSGRILTAAECRLLIEELYGARVDLPPEALASVGRSAILYRMLNNLKSMYLAARQPELALWATDRMLIVDPGSVRDMYDRGVLNYTLGRHSRGASDLTSCLIMHPASSQTQVVQRHLSLARQKAGLLN